MIIFNLKYIYIAEINLLLDDKFVALLLPYIAKNSSPPYR